MNQQDYTAPKYEVRQSAKEQYQDVFQLTEADGVTPDTSLKDAVVAADLYADRTQQRLDVGQVAWVSSSAVQVGLTTQQLGKLRAGRYRLEVYTLLAGEREDLVHVMLELV